MSAVAFASLWRRIAALLLDMLLLSVGIFIIRHLAIQNQAAAVAAVPLQGFLFFFYILYLHGKHGQTVGKRVMKIKVVRVDGAPVGFARSARRSIISGLESVPWVVATMIAISQIPESQYLPLQARHMRDLELSLRPAWYDTTDWIITAVFLAELASCFLTRRRQSLADLMAGTMVVDVYSSKTAKS